MREGKIKEKTIDEFLEELRKERENELQDSTNSAKDSEVVSKK